MKIEVWQKGKVLGYIGSVDHAGHYTLGNEKEAMYLSTEEACSVLDNIAYEGTKANHSFCIV